MPISTRWFLFELALFAAGLFGLSWLLATELPEWVAIGTGLVWAVLQVLAGRRYELWRLIESADPTGLCEVYDGI